MKLIIQIPCYNEEQSLPITLAELPREVPGIDKVEWLIIDDGSTDRTVEVARKSGVDHVISLPKNQGLAKAFIVGLEACINNGADIIVNTDADNQYCAKDIPKLIAPVLSGKADITVGTRPISDIAHFSQIKKYLQKIGSMVVRLASATDTYDATSGFRAISRYAAMRINVFNEYTYALETIIQAGQKGMSIVSVPIRVNKDLRPSRLVKNIPSYVSKSIITIIRIFVVYKPFRFFVTIGVILFITGFMLCIRYLYHLFHGGGSGHIQSLILASILLGIGYHTMLVAFLADLLSVNRKLLEEVNSKQKEHEIKIKQQDR